jgi:hypothetical protein
VEIFFNDQKAVAHDYPALALNRSAAALHFLLKLLY